MAQHEQERLLQSSKPLHSPDTVMLRKPFAKEGRKQHQFIVNSLARLPSCKAAVDNWKMVT